MVKKKKHRRNQMHKKSTNGPLYQKYFFAFSDKMIIQRIFPVTNLFFIYSELNKIDDIPVNDEIISMAFYDTSGDSVGKYGTFFIPENQFENFLDNDLVHRFRKLSPRELNPSYPGLTYLANYNSSSTGEMGRLTKEIFSGYKILPFRNEDSLTIEDKLRNSGLEIINEIPLFGLQFYSQNNKGESLFDKQEFSLTDMARNWAHKL